MNCLARAQTAPALLNTLFPPAGQAGERVEVSASGKGLDGATALHFSIPGIEAKPLSSNAGSATFEVRIPSDTAPGIYEARVVGRSGISNARAFLISRDSESTSVPSTSPDKAADLPLSSARSGRCAAGAAHYYAIPLHRGNSLLLECAAESLDSRMIPALLLFDAEGREVARARTGGVISFTAPADGRYLLKLHDLMFRGGPEYFYHLSASSRPHIDHIFPPIGRPGTTSVYTLYGRNLPSSKPSDWRIADGTPLERMDVEITLPSQFADGRFDYHLKCEAGDSNSVFIDQTNAPIITTPSAKLTIPSTIAGLLRESEDRYDFDAVKGQSYAFEVLSDRLGPPAAIDVVLQSVTPDSKGVEQVRDVREINGIDAPPESRVVWNGAPSRDVTFTFPCSATGTYRLLVRDLLHGSGNGGTTPFALTIRPPSPDFTLAASPALVVKNTGRDMQSSAGILLRRGESFPIELSIFRQDGFDSPVHVECQGMPPGISGQVDLPAAATQGVLFIRADDSAETWAGPVKIVATAKLGDRQLHREAQYQMVVWGSNENDAPIRRPAADLALGVCPDLTPLTIESAAAGEKPLHPQGVRKLTVPLKLTRRAQLKSPLRVRVCGLPQFATLPDLTLPPTPDDNPKLDVDLGPQRLRPGIYTIYLEAEGQFQFADPPPPPSTKPAATVAPKKPGPAAFQAIIYSGPIRFEVP